MIISSCLWSLSCIIMIHGNHGADHEGFEVLKNTFRWIRENAARLGHRHNHETCELMSHGESVVDFGRIFRRIRIFFAFFPFQHISIFKHFHFGLRCVSGWLAASSRDRTQLQMLLPSSLLLNLLIYFFNLLHSHNYPISISWMYRSRPTKATNCRPCSIENWWDPMEPRGSLSSNVQRQNSSFPTWNIFVIW